MLFVIQIKDGNPFEHPIHVMNLKQVFPDIDLNNLPPQFAPFERIEVPPIGVYQKYEGVTYGWVDGIVKDIHNIRDMTSEEKIAKQNEVKASWNNRYPSWTFDEDLCQYRAPVPYPQDGKAYQWNEESLSWVEFPVNS